MAVTVRRLPPGGAVFLTQLMVGEALGPAAAAALAENPAFDIAVNLAGMLSAGAFAGIAGGQDNDGA
jgi:hypothetical protein